ncbi:LysR family transcriptional regulator [Sphingomonas sp. PP-CE-1A-559]|uniref:LysR family transcriptional regulator n=1 Tax=Sphingomonas sp. PP-CE-1A-559 TaxID=2135657 RepID=UPI0010550C07|nr:LysR family transcriptional regulator [Sphingomonas sp. PP-CE-1A-559]TCP88026.1 LysR family transcriptional regulator [Sphingomonas sp. PP-CE-1A-559]
MRYRGLDLNLLSAFDVLMQERSVSRAARHLNLSQPAMSAALARLREFFGDELLVNQGKRMYPTAFAEALVPQVRGCLHGLDAMLTTSARFDPATSQRTFRLIASDYIIAAVIVPVVEHLARDAPGVRLELAAPSETGEAEIAEGRADILISPDAYVRGDHPAELLFEEPHVVVGWAENPLMRQKLSEADFMAAGHVGVRIGTDRAPAFADRQMSTMGKVRRIEVETSSFLTIPLLLCGTPRLAVMQARLAHRMCRTYPLRSQAPPFDFPPMREMIQYHASRSTDEGLNWLKSLIHFEADHSSIDGMDRSASKQ